MPIIQSAKKKLRQDKTRTLKNLKYNRLLQNALKAIRKGGKDNLKLISRAFSAIDKAAKKRIIHKNKANRLKSKIGKLKK